MILSLTSNIQFSLAGLPISIHSYFRLILFQGHKFSLLKRKIANGDIAVSIKKQLTFFQSTEPYPKIQQIPTYSDSRLVDLSRSKNSSNYDFSQIQTVYAVLSRKVTELFQAIHTISKFNTCCYYALKMWSVFACTGGKISQCSLASCLPQGEVTNRETRQTSH